MNNSHIVVLRNTDAEQELYEFRIIMNSIGTCISLAGYILMVLTATLFPSWRKTKQNQVWLHMCGAYLLFFLSDFYTHAVPITNPFVSALVEHIKKYVVRISLCWMLVGAVLTYKNLVDVFSITNSFMLKATFYSYFVPFVFVGVTYTLYVVEHPEDIYQTNINKKPDYNLYLEEKYKIAIWYTTFVLNNFLLVVPIYGSIIYYLRITYSLYKNRKVQGHERDLASTVALGFFFVVTCCVQCAIITAKYIFGFGGMWSYVTICLQSFHVTTYSTLFVVCNKVTRETWIKFLKSKIMKRM